MRIPAALRSLLLHPFTGWLLPVMALLLRLGWLAWVNGQPLLADAAYYVEDARTLLHGGGLGGFWPPLLPAWLAGWMGILGETDFVARVSMLPWFVAGAWAVHRLGMHWGGLPAARLALLLYAVYPSLIQASVEPLSQLPAGVCLALCAAAGLRLRVRPDLRELFLLGVSGGMMLLIRPALALALPVCLLYLWPSLRARIWQPALLMLLPALLWSAWLSKREGHTVLINESHARNLYLGNTPWTPDYKTWYLASHWGGETWIDPAFLQEHDSLKALPQPQQGTAWTARALHYIREAPGRFVVRMFSRMRCFLAFDTLPATTLHTRYGWGAGAWAIPAAGDALCWLLTLLGFCAWMMQAWYARPDADRRLLNHLFTAVLLPYLLTFAHPTYHQALLPLLIPAAAAWLAQPSMQGIPRRGRILLGLAVAGILLMQGEWVWHLLHPGP